MTGALGLLEGCQQSVSPAGSDQAPAGNTRKAPRVVFISTKPSDSFVTAIKNGADFAAKEYGLDYLFQAPNNTTFPELIQVTLGAIATRPDGMAINYYDKTFEDSTSKALDAGIQVVLYTNNRFEGENAPSDPRIPMLAFVGQDESTSGVKLAQAFLPRLPNGATVLYVNPYPMFPTLQMRRDGIARVLEPAGHPVQTLNLNNSGDEGQYLSVIGPYLQAHPEVGAVISGGTSGANPSAKYVADNHLSLPIATFDVGETVARYIQRGIITLAINQQPFLEGYFAVADLALNLKYGVQPVNVNTGTQFVDESNVDRVLQLIAEGKG
ncbi:MAG: substrate-binding domain-containing protein [Chloroflexi bacterium]|nr:substrate-binding domain-containing protein [Chloroflexota bacterium]